MRTLRRLAPGLARDTGGAVLIETALAHDWTLPARLDRVRISETERNIFELEAK